MMLEKVRRWLRFNLFYLGKPPWDTGVTPPEVLDFLESSQPGRAMDLGCGTGTNLLTMAERGWDVAGIDLAWLSIWRSRRKLREAGFVGHVINGNVTGDYHFEAPFDFVLDMGCYHGLTQTERHIYHKKLTKRLKPGGTYMIYAHRKTVPDEDHGITDEDLAAFGEIMTLVWRKDSGEERPDGGGGRPATWARFQRKE